jgi:hypothetical protein
MTKMNINGKCGIIGRGKTLKNQKENAPSTAERKEPSEIIRIDNVGTVKVFGEWNAEKLIKRLLKSDKIIR